MRSSPWSVDTIGWATAAAALAGCLLAFTLATLPHPAFAWLGLVIGLAVWATLPRLRLPAAVLAGFAWTCLVGGWAMDARLAHELQGSDLQIEGQVAGLPARDGRSLRFDFDVEHSESPADALAGERIRLSWYGEAPELAPGSRWQLAVKLKRPRGVVNPGGFDYERYALERRIAATGYVRESSTNRTLAPGGGIDALRLRISAAIARAVGAHDARFVQALAVGDTRALDESDWEVMRATGIAHLIAISGLHVGLVAGLGALLVRLLYRLIPALGLRVPLPQGAAFGALLAAAGYTALAGFALPTVRTLLMIAAALLAIVLRRATSPSQAFALALLAILAFDPLSALGAGFWLSFVGVAWLLWCLPREGRTRPLLTLLSAQGVMTLSLLPLTVWFFGQASVAGPVANLVAVPWVSFVVVPVTLAGTAATLIHEPLGAPLFVSAAWLMQLLWAILEPLASWRGALVYLPTVAWPAMTLAVIAAFWLLLPRGVPGKALALLLFAPLLWPARETLLERAFDLTLLDVGQGLSVLVRTREHALLYDAGPAFEGGLDLGGAAVVPALHALGVARLDAYVESHRDNDHAGGTGAVTRAYSPARFLATRRTLPAGATRCEAGSTWTWDGVEFSVLHPPGHFPDLGNDSSCVLRIASRYGVVLLPGDISEQIEARLRRSDAASLASDVLVMPHHGSRTSSSEAFIEAVDPDIALIGVGHRNRFDLPREEVIARYRERDIDLFDSASGGAIQLQIGAGGVTGVHRWRDLSRRFWREPD
jgi:competence protein ComEC